MKKLTLAALVLVAPAAFAVPVSYGASAAFTTLEYRVVDLDLNDGIAAGVSFVSHLSGLLAEAYQHNIAESRHSSDVKFSRPSGTAQASTGSAFSFLTGEGGSFAATVSGSAYSKGFFDAYESRASGALTMVLAPNTAVEWLASYALTAWATQGRGASATRSASASIAINGFHADVAAFANPDLGLGRQTASNTYSFSISNATRDSAFARTEFFASTTGGQVAPIPEPSSWLMGLAGLGALGVVIRRRSPGRERDPLSSQGCRRFAA